MRAREDELTTDIPSGKGMPMRMPAGMIKIALSFVMVINRPFDKEA